MVLAAIEPLEPVNQIAGESDQALDGALLIKSVTAVMDQGKPNAHLYAYRGALNAQQGDQVAAELDYSETIRLKPNFTIAYFYRGIAHHKNRNFDGAITDFTVVIRSEKYQCQGYINRGYAHLARVNDEQALADFDEVIRLNPFGAQGHTGRANVFLSQREFDRALAECEVALHRDPRDSSALDARGTTRAHLKDYDGAEADFREVLKLCPDRSRSHSNLGWLALLREDYAQAITWCDEAIRRDGKNGAAYYSRGTARAAQGDIAGAVSDYRQSLIDWPAINSKLGIPFAQEMQAFLEKWGSSLSEHSDKPLQ
jgi:tetratricopeptide (TPR) repeat protein